MTRSTKMSQKLSVPALPESERREKLAKFLGVFDQHPGLAHYRAALRTGEERQLALFAALERAVVVGPPAATPPGLDDEADQLLCDLLDVIDTDPELKNMGSYYGPDRHLINLQAFGVWKGDQPVSQPTARELFTTRFSGATAEPQSDLPASGAINSPASQELGPNGDLITDKTTDLPSDQTGIIHHAGSP